MNRMSRTMNGLNIVEKFGLSGTRGPVACFVRRVLPRFHRGPGPIPALPGKPLETVPCIT